MDLPNFLLARIAEDEDEAREMADSWPYDGGWSPEHVARVLVECDAKRRIVEEHSEDGGWGEESGACIICNRARFPCQTLRLLTLPYAAHPDYREEWRV